MTHAQRHLFLVTTLRVAPRYYPFFCARQNGHETWRGIGARPMLGGSLSITDENASHTPPNVHLGSMGPACHWDKSAQ